MFVILVMIGCLLLYRKSKYFPHEADFLLYPFRRRKIMLNMAGLALLLVAAILSTSRYGWGTGLLIFFTTVIFSFCLVIVVLPLHKKLVYILAGACIVLIMLENLL